MSLPCKYENVTEGLHLCIQILAVQWNELECATMIFFDNVWLIIYFWLKQSVREIHLNSFVRTLFFWCSRLQVSHFETKSLSHRPGPGERHLFKSS